MRPDIVVVLYEKVSGDGQRAQTPKQPKGKSQKVTLKPSTSTRIPTQKLSKSKTTPAPKTKILTPIPSTSKIPTGTSTKSKKT